MKNEKTQKQTISVENSNKKLFAKLEKLDMGDKIYEVASDLFHAFVTDIEEEHSVADEGGVGEMWYDMVEEDFREACYEKMLNFLKGE